jgi:hypothetical protein
LSLMARLKIGGYFALWYMLNVIYNSELCADFCDIIANICHSLYHRYSSQPHLQNNELFQSSTRNISMSSLHHSQWDHSNSSSDHSTASSYGLPNFVLHPSSPLVGKLP